MYFVKAPSLLKKIYPEDLVWRRETLDTVYLTFDDGPHPFATQFALSELAKYDAKATFFCIGKNVINHPDIYTQILMAGHKVGNHTHTHLNGWKSKTEIYIQSIREANQFIQSNLFRPPYGRIRKNQAEEIKRLGYSVIMWDVLSGDFDTKITPEKCWENIEQNIEPGSIIVFHDSSKAWERMKYALTRTLEFCQKQGWKMKTL
ncbi:MAG: polysaccharide deacetylase family protein [Bacteroidota bacterium]